MKVSSHKPRNVLLALGWYDHRLLQGIATYASEHRWHLAANSIIQACRGNGSPGRTPKHATRAVAIHDSCPKSGVAHLEPCRTLRSSKIRLMSMTRSFCGQSSKK